MSKFYQIDKEITTDVWLTPPNIINALGKFDLDPCCPNNLKWKTADKHYSLENGEDGLEKEWSGRVWLNPPYSNWGQWLQKLSIHNNGIALIFCRTDTKAWNNFVWPFASGLFFIKGRIKFLKSDGIGLGASTAPSVLISYGNNNNNILSQCCLDGKFINLKS